MDSKAGREDSGLEVRMVKTGFGPNQSSYTTEAIMLLPGTSHPVVKERLAQEHQEEGLANFSRTLRANLSLF